MGKPTITVLMPVHNDERFLEESIVSILRQSFDDFEFIIINDASRDCSWSIIKKYAKEDRRIVAINNRVNIGIARSLNEGLKLAKGKYIARMDGDDISVPERLMLEYKFLDKHPEYFLVGGGIVRINESGKETFGNRPITNEKKLVKKLEKKNVIDHPTIMFRNESGIHYREKLVHAEDYDFYLNLLTDGKRLINLSQILVKLRVNPQSVSYSHLACQVLMREKAREFYFQRLQFGNDEYDGFEPGEILNVDLERSTDKRVLEAYVKSNLNMGELRQAREVVKRYFQHHGFLSKFLFYYLASYLNKNLLTGLRRVLKI